MDYYHFSTSTDCENKRAAYVTVLKGTKIKTVLNLPCQSPSKKTERICFFFSFRHSYSVVASYAKVTVFAFLRLS